MVKYLYFIFFLGCYACASNKSTSIDSNGITAQISFNPRNAQMNDSIVLSVVLSNSTSHDVVLDSCLRIHLSHHDAQGFAHYDTPERIAYLVYQEKDSLVIPANEQNALDIKLQVKPEFFYNGINTIYALLQCHDYYDETKKAIVRTQNKASIYSNACDIRILF